MEEIRTNNTYEKMPKRILCVFGLLGRGGSETMCMELYRHINRSIIQFDFVTHSGPGGAYEEEIKALGGRIYYCPAYKGYNDLSYRKWWHNHLTNHPEHKIIHGHYFTISSVYFEVAHRYGCITIGHCHNPEPSNLPALRKVIYNHFCRKVEKQSDVCLACSNNAGRYLFPHKHFTVLNNAIDSKRFIFNEETRERVRKELGIEGKYVIGNVGSLMAPKNHIFMLDIIEMMSRKDRDTVLLLVGDGPLRANIENSVRIRGLGDSVMFLGTRSDVADLLNAMDVFLFPSLYEGLGIAAIEAQASGLPVVCSDKIPQEANVTDLIEHLSLNESKEVWVDALNRHRSTHQRCNMRQQIVDAGFDIETTARWLEKFYLGLEQIGFMSSPGCLS